MEKQFFDWEDWDSLSDSAVQFYDCTLKIDMGTFKAGDKVNSITMDYGDSASMEFFDKDGNSLAKFSLTLTATVKQ